MSAIPIQRANATRVRAHPAACALLLLAASGCKLDGEAKRLERDVGHLITQARYEDALRVAEEDFREQGDAESEELYRIASVAFLLDRGREETLRDEDEAALATFMEALALGPDSPQVHQWVENTRSKLARRWFEIARDRHTEDDLPEALEAYEQALAYDPYHEGGAAGILRVGRQLQYREGLSQDYYNEGLGALRDEQLWLASSRFNYSGKYRPWDSKPARRAAEVSVEIARLKVDRAAILEADGFYAAARTEFRVALALDAENEEAQVGLERMQVEADAHELLKKGEMWLLRGAWDEARAALEEGMAKTAVQHAAFEEVLSGIEADRVAAAYQGALNLERDFRYEDAALAFGAILDEHGFYEDARARLTSLEATIAEVRALYQSLGDVAEPEEQRSILLQIDALWPEYHDVEELLEALGPPPADAGDASGDASGTAEGSSG